MLAKKPVTLPKLISYILSFTEETNEDNLNNMFTSQIKSNDEFNLTYLGFGESRNINDLPDKLRSLLDPYLKDFIRYGSRNIENDNNLTLYFSILTHIIKGYYSLASEDQYNYITKLRDKLIMYMSTSNILRTQGYDKLGWVKKDIMTSLISFKTNKLILKIMADYLNLNIFILNTVEDKIYAISENDNFNMFRASCFLVYHDDIFEPLVYNNSPILDYNSSPVNKLVTVDKAFIILMDTVLITHSPLHFNLKLCDLSKFTVDIPNPVTSVENEYGEVIPEESDANAYIKDIEKSETDTNISTNIGTNISASTNIPQQLIFKISPKMKLDELQTIAKKLNVELEKNGLKKKTNKTKGELIEEINSVLKKK